MIESNRIVNDSFTTNDNKNDASANVSTYLAAPDVQQFGGSISNSSFVTTKKLDLSLAEYLSRPKLLYSGTLTTFLATPGVYDFAYDFMSAADIKAKTKYVHLVRGTFQAKLVVTAAPYATGRMGFATMYGTNSEYGAAIIDTNLTVANLASKTNVMLDLGSANTCMLSVPLHINRPYIRNEAPDLAELRKMKLYFFTLTQLLNSQTNTPVDVNYKIYVSLVDAETSIPVPIGTSFPTVAFRDESVGSYMKTNTVFNLDESDEDQHDQIDEQLQSEIDDAFARQTSESKEANHGVISAPASIVSNIAGKLKDAPVIGPMAMATQIGADAVGSIARLFGFSRPRDFSKPGYPHAPNLSSAVGEVRAKQLTTDPNQEITIDSRYLGESGDSLSYENTIYRPGFAGRFSWRQDQAVGTTVFTLPVSPRFCYGVGQATVNYFAPTPLAYCASLFTAWRGTIKYKFCMPANRFVRGKLRVYWTPQTTNVEGLDIISNNSLSVLIDLTQTIDMEISVPWMSDNLWKAVGPYINTTQSANDDTINGYLVFIVEEPLIANNSTWYVDTVIYESAAPDFEFAIQDNAGIQTALFDVYSPGAGYQYIAPVEEVLAPSTEYTYVNNDWATKTASSNSVNPSQTESISLLPDSAPSEEPAMIHIGESVASLRTVLKRFHPLWFRENVTMAANPRFFSDFIPYFPMPKSTETLGGGYAISPYNTTPASFLSRMFAGVRGTMRYSLVVGAAGADQVYIGRCYGHQNVVRTMAPTAANAQAMNNYLRGGINAYKYVYEPLVVDVPFQNYRWFYPTSKRL